MPQDACGPSHGAGNDRPSTRANAVQPKILFAELLYDKNPADDWDDALETIVHGSVGVDPKSSSRRKSCEYCNC